MEIAIWVIGLLAAAVIIVIYIITSVNKYSNKFVGKYFDEEKDGKISGVTEVSDNTRVNILKEELKENPDTISEKQIKDNSETGE